MSDKKQRTGPWLQTASGVQLFPFDLDLSQVYPHDVAHHLAHQCRFAGACHGFYSVAQHAVLVAKAIHDAAYELGEEGAAYLALAGLHHDDEEFILIDFPRPLKADPRMRWYVELGDKYRMQINDKWGVPRWAQEHPLIHEYDGVLLATEARDLMVYPPPVPWDPMPTPLIQEISSGWDPMDATAEYLYYWQELAEKLGTFQPLGIIDAEFEEEDTP